MRVAIIHDNLIQFGGAERVLASLLDIFPNAPVYTLLYDRQRAGLAIDERRVRTSFLQRIPGARQNHHYFPLLMPMAMEQFDLHEFDVVFSATHSYAKGVITGPNTLHISYCFTPTRYVWDDCHRYVRDFSRLALSLRLAPLGLSYIRLWDYFASQRVDNYLTLSNFVAARIAKYYGRSAEVVPPPVDVERFAITRASEGYYLVVSRLVPYKRTELAIEACERLGRPLKIAGTGPEIDRLRERAGEHTEFLGFVPDAKLPAVYAGARALLFPQEEDFGITPLEAAAAGVPTIAYGFGGALETIVDGETGVFFQQQSADALANAIVVFEKGEFDSASIRQHAEGFSGSRFAAQITDITGSLWEQYKTKHTTRI
jgi:glycosyltransferase involved in cell wall biosynthesis